MLKDICPFSGKFLQLGQLRTHIDKQSSRTKERFDKEDGDQLLAQSVIESKWIMHTIEYSNIKGDSSKANEKSAKKPKREREREWEPQMARARNLVVAIVVVVGVRRDCSTDQR